MGKSCLTRDQIPHTKMANNNDFNSLTKKKGFKLVHLNIRSLLKKIDQLRVILINSQIEILTISETWLREAHPTKSLDINGYTAFRQDRQGLTSKTKGGGLITYVIDKWADNTVQLKNLNTCTGDIEAQWLKITRPNSRNLVICNLYRPPAGDLSKCTTYMSNCLTRINMHKQNIFILGDWNVNYKNSLSPSYKKLTFFESRNHLKQIIKDTTRNTSTSKTLIDLIQTNAKFVSESGTLDSYLSDHQPIFVIIKKNRSQVDLKEFVGRSYKNLNLESLLGKLNNSDWQPLFAETNPEQAWDQLLSKLTTELDKVCPLKKSKIRDYLPDWINPQLREVMKDRDYFYQKAKASNAEDDWNIAKHLRNIANAGVRQAKATFVRKQLHDSAKDGAKFWRELKQIFPATKSKTKSSKIQLVNNSTNLEVPENDTANYINDYFVNVGNLPQKPNNTTNLKKGPKHKPKTRTRDRASRRSKLARKLMSNQAAPSDEKWSIPIFTEGEVWDAVTHIETNKSSGIPHLRNSILKAVLKALLTQLTFILNLSIETALFPDSWKEALVIPIPKSGDLSSVANFRPISLLPQPGKILEKLVHNKVNHYIEHNLLMSDNQHGFRRNRSTIDSLFQRTRQINHNMDKRFTTLATFIDFRKAFDCVQHNLLLKKLKTLNLAKSTIEWFESYLHHRQQRVLANNKTSDRLTITQGVPQGSIVGPLLYIIYANDITKIIKHSQIALYADDTVLYSKCKSPAKARSNMQKDLKGLESWCNRNGIFINASKTKCMIFGSKVALAKVTSPDTNLTVGGQQITRVHSYCYLGITLDEQLNYELQAQSIIRKVNNKVIQLGSMRYFLNKQAALLVFKNMILPILEYGDVFLSALSASTSNILQTLQNKALRLVLDRKKELSTNELHAAAGLRKLKFRRKLHTLQYLSHKKHDHKLIARRANGRITRSSGKVLFILPKPSTEKFKSSLAYSGLKLWNQLPSCLQNIPDIKHFKRRIETLTLFKPKTDAQ